MDFGAIMSFATAARADARAGKMTDRQLAILEKQLADLAGVPLPDLQRAVAEQMGPSELGGLRRDESLRHEQLAALEALRDIAGSGGMSLSDKVGLEAANQQADNADRRRRASILAELAGRGQLDSGAQLAASLSSTQDAANRGRASSQEAAARGESRRMEALRDLMTGTSNLRRQDFGEESQKAAARDEIARWSAGAREKANFYNLGLPQQQFNNQITKVTGQQTGANNLASAIGNEAAGVRARGDQTAQAVGAATNSATSGIERWATNSGGGPRSEAGERPVSYDTSGTPVYSDLNEWEDPWAK